MLSVWMIIIIKFIPMWKTMSKAVVIEESTAREFLNYGNIVLILLAVFNGLYLIEFIYAKIFFNIFTFIKSKLARPILPS